MLTFCDWLSCSDVLGRLRLIETYYSFNAGQYNQLFNSALAGLRVSAPDYREAIARMRGFNWVGYIAKSVRNAGYSDEREVQERTHDVCVKLLTGGLFRDYEEGKHGPLDMRFKRAVANAIRNMIEKERNLRRCIPTVPIDQEPGAVPNTSTITASDDEDRLIEGFRQLVRTRLGDLGVAILDARLQGQEMKNLVGDPSLGRPGKSVIKRLVQEIKALAREFAIASGDAALSREIERAMKREGVTIRRRLAAARRNS